MQNIIFDDGENKLWYRKDFVKDIYTGGLKVSDFANLRLIKDPPVMVYGKLAHQHRSVGFYSDTVESYPYSGQEIIAQPMPDSIREIMEKINEDYDREINGCLVNKYKDGTDYIGYHRDNQPTIDQNYVATVSFGARRKMVIREYSSKAIVETVQLLPNMLLVMEGPTFQTRYTHEIPVQKKVLLPRLSLTFRKHIEK